MDQAIREACEMLGCMSDYPDAFRNNYPAPNQVIDLSNAATHAPGANEKPLK
jgi:hypothetical protein